MGDQRSNFDILEASDTPHFKLTALAKSYVADSPISCLIKLRHYDEALPQQLIARTWLYPPTTLTKVFRGELVPQDPNNDPASALFTGMRVELGGAALTKRRRARSA